MKLSFDSLAAITSDIMLSSIPSIMIYS